VTSRLHRGTGILQNAALPLLAALLCAAACGRGDVQNQATPQEGTPASSPAAAPAAAAPAPPPALAPEDPLEAVRDSIQEAEDYRRRLQSMETLESCLAKVKGLPPEVRAPIEAACRRSPRGR
jgi:hypothetical protein